MTYYKIKEETLTGIAYAIREKCGTAESYSPGQMAAAISGIQSGAVLNIAYGDTEPEDTSKLWVKTAEPAGLEIRSQLGPGNEEMDLGVAYLPLPLYSMAAAAIGTTIYVFGGYTHMFGNVRKETIYAFDTVTETITTLSTTLPTGAEYVAAAAVGTQVFLFGGKYDTESDLATINRFTAAVPLAENALLIDAPATQNLVELISSGTVDAQVGVANVYMGNAQGFAEKVSAAVYKDGAWVEI